jgi:hypothetical protein
MKNLIRKILKEESELQFIKFLIVKYLIKNGVPLNQQEIAAVISPQLQIDDEGKLKIGVDIKINPQEGKLMKLDREKISVNLKLSKNETELLQDLTDDEIIKEYGQRIGFSLKTIKDLLKLLDYEGKPVMFFEENTFYLTTPNMNFGEWTSARGYV